MKLVTTRPFAARVEERLRAIAPDLQIVTAESQGALLAEVADADILMGSFGGGSGDAFRRVLEAAPKVRWVHTSSAGVDDLMGPHVLERDFVFTCGKGESVASLLAEHAFALLLSVTRGIVAAARFDSWRREAFGNLMEVRGLTMGIVGFGAVGRALATRANAFGMRVVGVRAHPDTPPEGVDAVWGPEMLPHLLEQSDVVVLILPHTPETRGSFGERELRRMKQSAILINVGRGQVVDGPALERALVEGWIAGAGLDVMPEEPWPSSSPLWRMDNVIVTPHTAGNSPNRAGRDMDVFVENMARFVRGEPLLNTVDRRAAY